MNKSFSLSTKLFIVIVCYAPIFSSIIPKTNFGGGLPDLDLVRVSTILLFCSFFFDVFKQGSIKFNSWIIIILIYSINVAASVSWSKAYSYDARMIASLFDTLFVPMFIAIVGMNIFQNIESRKRYARHIMFAVCALSIMCIYEAFFDIVQFGGITRAATTLGNPNLVAIILVLWLPLILISEREEWLSKKYSILVQVIILMGIIGTVSRKGLITWFVTYVLFFYLNKEKHKVIILSVLGGIGFIILLAYSSAVSTRFSGADVEYNLDAKWNMMMAGVQMFFERPIIGYGYNGYFENFGRFFRYSWVDKYDAHNEYVTALASYGFIGFVWFTALFVVPFFYLRKKYKKERPTLKSKKIKNHSDTQFYIMGISLIPPIMMSTFYAGALFKQPVAVISFFAQISFATAITFYNKKNIKKTDDNE